MKSSFLPALLSVLIFLTAMVAAVSSYKSSGSISAWNLSLIFAGLGAGVLTMRQHELAKRLETIERAHGLPGESMPEDGDGPEEN